MQEPRPTSQKRWLRLLIAAIVVAVLAPSPIPQPMISALRRSSVALASGRPAAALESLQEVIQFNPDLRSAHYWAAESAFRSGKPEQALRFLETWRQSSPEDSQAVCWRGHALAQTGQYEGALEAWEMALASCPQNDLILERMAAVNEQLGDYEQAIQALERLAEAKPRDQELRSHLGLLLASVEPRHAAEHLAFVNQAQSSPDPMLVDILSVIHAHGGDEDTARLLVEIARVLLQYERWKLAERTLGNALVIEPNDPQALSLLGVAQVRGGGDPTSVLDAAERSSPNSPLNYILRSMQYLRVDEIDSAIAALKTAADLDPDNPAVWAQLGAAYAMNGDRELALENYLHAAEISEARADFWLLLAQFCNTNQYELRAVGLPAARNALTLQLEDASAMDALGYGYYLVGNLIMAERFLYRALDAAPTDPLTQYHFALLNIAKEDVETARSALRITLELARDDSLALMAERALDRLGR
jgi:tetratricopeptide (TPR) repeat protein